MEGRVQGRARETEAGGGETGVERLEQGDREYRGL
jgi:hypothetical protein